MRIHEVPTRFPVANLDALFRAVLARKHFGLEFEARRHRTRKGRGRGKQAHWSPSLRCKCPTSTSALPRSTSPATVVTIASGLRDTASLKLCVSIAEI